jgi:phosphonate transport system substrate-binding protein
MVSEEVMPSLRVLRTLRTLRRVVVAVGLVALGRGALAEGCENPEVIRFSLIPSQDSVRELTYYKPILDMLSRNTGKKIEFYMPTSYSSVMEALLGKWVDVAVLGPESYIIARNKDHSVEVFGTYSRKADGLQEAGPGYKSVLITKKGSKFGTIESLRGAVLALVDPASTSGALIPERVFSKQIGQPLREYFSKVVFSGGHDLSALAVAEGKADAAFVATHRLMEVVNAGKVKASDFNVLWSSPRLPQDPFVYRTTLCEPLRQKIAETFLSVDQNPDGRKYLDNVKSERFVKMADTDYDIIREVAK